MFFLSQCMLPERVTTAGQYFISVGLTLFFTVYLCHYMYWRLRVDAFLSRFFECERKLAKLSAVVMDLGTCCLHLYTQIQAKY